MQSYELSTCVQGMVHLKNLHLFRLYFWLKPCYTVSISSFPRNEIQSSPYVPNRGKKNNKMIRDLTEEEMAFINEQPINRTDSEVKAYRLLPKSLKMDVERNQPIAFTEGGLCRPDFLWRYKRICLEIDGGCHKFKVRHDNIKNWAFRKNGFIVIRIVNMDVRVNVCFWQRLLDGLKVYKYERPELEPILNELQEMIDNEIKSWTRCED